MLPHRLIPGWSLALIMAVWLGGSGPALANHGGIVFVKAFEAELRGKLMVLPAGAWLPLEQDPEHGFVCQVGGCYFRVHANLAVHQSEARDFASEVLVKNPMIDVGYRVMAHLRCLEGDLKKALVEMDKAIGLAPTPYAHDYLARGKIRASLGMVDQAISDFSRAAELSKRMVHRPLALVHKGQIHLEKGQIREALADWDLAADLAPRYADPLRLKAWVLCTHPSETIRNSEKALQLALKATELLAHSHGEVVALETLAAAYAEKGDYLGAIRTLSKAFDSMGPRTPTQVTMMEQFMERRPYRHGFPAKEPERVTLGK